MPAGRVGNFSKVHRRNFRRVSLVSVAHGVAGCSMAPGDTRKFRSVMDGTCGVTLLKEGKNIVVSFPLGVRRTGVVDEW